MPGTSSMPGEAPAYLVALPKTSTMVAVTVPVFVNVCMTPP